MMYNIIQADNHTSVHKQIVDLRQLWPYHGTLHLNSNYLSNTRNSFCAQRSINNSNNNNSYNQLDVMLNNAFALNFFLSHFLCSVSNRTQNWYTFFLIIHVDGNAYVLSKNPREFFGWPQMWRLEKYGCLFVGLTLPWYGEHKHISVYGLYRLVFVDWICGLCSNATQPIPNKWPNARAISSPYSYNYIKNIHLDLPNNVQFSASFLFCWMLVDLGRNISIKMAVYKHFL